MSTEICQIKQGPRRHPCRQLVYKTVLSQNGVFRTILPQPEVLKAVAINSQLFIKVNAIIETILNVKAKSFKF